MSILVRTFLLSVFLMMICAVLFAQNLSALDKKLINKKEDSLQIFADSMINGLSPAKRFRSDSVFTKMLVRALQVKNSFYYPFDSLKTVSRLYAPDSSFRIFTWQLKKDDYMFMQKGAIQMRTPTGDLKLMNLFDASMFTSKPLDSVRTRKTWIGAIYYRIIEKTYNGKKYYTLLGFDDFTVSSSRKWMEVLSFNDNDEPVFGGPFISFKEDSTKKAPLQRFNIEYKKDARTTFNYDPELDMIVYDHLISETEEPEKKDTYIPDGDFEGFKWRNGQWVHVDKVFNFSLKDGEAPIEQALRDKEGKINEQKLIEQSQKNEQIGTKPAPVKKKK
ncbi:MAG: hypothetical protein ABIN89_31160 [Chitinophagaceae bacterium]